MVLLLATQGKAWAGALCGQKPLREPGAETHLTHRGETKGRLPATTLEVLAPSSLHPPQGEMQKNTSLPPTSPPVASNALQGAGRQASPSGTPSESETGCPDSPKVHQKPSISKVILGVVTHKGAHRHVTLTTLKKAVATAGYNMTQNAWRFKRAVKGLVDKGMLKQVTGKGALGSFRIGNKYASKVKGRSQSRRQSGQRRSGQRRSGQRRAGQRRPGQRRLQAVSQKGHKRLNKGVRRVARCRRN